MDPAVLKAMAKWPAVPSVYGWLALDRRGNWTIKGEPIGNPAVAAFIGRNYDRDPTGRWFFQNGPQRVFVTLAYTPFVLRVEPVAGTEALVMHTGALVTQPREGLVDEHGNLLITFERGVGLVCDRDLARVLPGLRRMDGPALTDSELERLLAHDARLPAVTLDLGAAALTVHPVQSNDLPSRFAFDPQPRPAPGEPEC